MKPSTRTALKLAPGATDADAAAALCKDGHALSLRGLEQSDCDLVLYLRQQQPEAYGQLYTAEYGKAPAGTAQAAPSPALASQAKTKLALYGATVTMGQLEKENPTLVLALKHHAPDEYVRLFTEYYGSAPKGVGQATAPVTLSAPATQAPSGDGPGTTYRPKVPVSMMMHGDMSEEDADKLFPKLGTPLANDDRFERVE